MLWDLAKRDGFLIASKDTYFLHLSVLKGHPPKVVYLEIGNCPKQAILRLLKDSMPQIAEFVADPIESFLILRPR